MMHLMSTSLEISLNIILNGQKNDQKEDSNGQMPTKATKIVSIPSFLKTRKFVILDLQTLDTYDYKIDVSSIMEM
jgi:hypothetical protein